MRRRQHVPAIDEGPAARKLPDPGFRIEVDEQDGERELLQFGVLAVDDVGRRRLDETLLATKEAGVVFHRQVSSVWNKH